MNGIILIVQKQNKKNIKSGLFRINDEGDIIVIQYYDKEGKPISKFN